MNTENALSNESPAALRKSIPFWSLFYRKIDFKIAVIIGLPLLLILVDESWIFSHVFRGIIDDWIYFGYFLDLKDHLKTFAGTYYGTRLPWIVPGALIYKIFSPLPATYILHLSVYYTSIISVYLILKRTIDKKTALLTAILMGLHYYFLQSVGNNYIDGAGLSYFLLTLLMLTNKEESRYLRTRQCFAGFFFACCIYTQLFLVTYTPLVILYFIYITRKHNPHSLKTNINLFTLGFFSATILFGCINHLYEGTFYFFLPIITWTNNFVSSGINPWWSSISNWWKQATWLTFPTILLIGSLLILIFHRVARKFPNPKILLFFQSFFITNTCIHILYQIFLKQPVLQYPFYSSYIIPSLFLALGSILGIAVKKLKSKEFYLLLAIVAIFCIAPYAFPFSFQWVNPFNLSLLLLPFLIGLAGVLSICLELPFFRYTAIVLFSICSALISICSLNTRTWSSNSHDSSLQKQAFLSVIDSIRAIQKMDSKGNTLFWYDGNHPLGSTFRSISSSYLWGYRLINEEFPVLKSKILIREPTLNDHIIILATKTNMLEIANQSLAQIGLKGELIHDLIIERGSIRYNMIHIKIVILK